MPEFFNVLPPADACALLFQHMTHRMPVENIQTAGATGRVTATALFAPHQLPTFRRSTMDGYAVRAADTHGASAALPALLTVTGEVPMGRAATMALRTGEAVLIHTGGMLPDDADAVVQVEHTQPVSGDSVEIEVFRAVAAGQNVLQMGEDVAPGEEVLPAGHRLRPQDIGGLLALGITEIAVSARPRVAILATGDEIIPPDQELRPGRVRDINSYTIAGLVAQAGCLPDLRGIAPDNREAMQAAAEAGLRESDMLVVTAGSSVSNRDMTVEVIAALGEPGVLCHGIATRPGKPTIVAAAGGKPVLGLPGNPVSAMIQFDMLGVPALYRLQGMPEPPPRPAIQARLSQNLPSASGREDYVPAQLEQTSAGWVARPVFGKSNLIYSLVKADGLIKVPLNRAGIPAGEWVEVVLF